MHYITHSPEETEKLGAALAQRLQPGTIIAYTGDLGAGKTAFTRGLAKGLGYTQPVTSPTYTIVNEYLGGRLPLFHFDMYRLASSDDLWDIGWEDYLERGGVCAVEWSENVADAMEGAIRVDIAKLSDNTREITIAASVRRDGFPAGRRGGCQWPRLLHRHPHWRGGCQGLCLGGGAALHRGQHPGRHGGGAGRMAGLCMPGDGCPQKPGL